MEHITYAGKKLPLRVSYYALKQYQKETGEDISKIDDKIENLEILLFHALVAGHRAENKEMIVTRNDIEFILDESLSEFNGVLTDSFPEPKQGQVAGQPSKKK